MESLHEHKKSTPENVAFHSEAATGLMKKNFGIDNLSNLELVQIRKTTEDILRRAENGEKYLEGIDREIIFRFFQDAYGLDAEYLHLNKVTREDGEKINEYIRRTREQAHLI